jgi:hypothetical protein
MPKIKVIRTSEEKQINQQRSVFHILVNTNKSEGDSDKEKLLKDLEKLGKNFDKVLKVVFDAAPLGDDAEIEYAYDVEFGNRQKRLHGHIAVDIRHDSRVQLDMKKIKSWANKRGYPVVYGRFIKSSDDILTVLKKYSRKNYKG